MSRALLAAALFSLAVVPATAHAFAALAVDAGGGRGHGWSADYDNAAGAATRAHQACDTHCRVVMQWDTGCGAYFADVAAGSRITAIGTGMTGEQARSNAYRACTDRGGFNCKLRVWACDRGSKSPVSGAP